jgi:hypothetical protein
LILKALTPLALAPESHPGVLDQAHQGYLGLQPLDLGLRDARHGQPSANIFASSKDA